MNRGRRRKRKIRLLRLSWVQLCRLHSQQRTHIYIRHLLTLATTKPSSMIRLNIWKKIGNRALIEKCCYTFNSRTRCRPHIKIWFVEIMNPIDGSMSPLTRLLAPAAWHKGYQVPILAYCPGPNIKHFCNIKSSTRTVRELYHPNTHHHHHRAAVISTQSWDNYKRFSEGGKKRSLLLITTWCDKKTVLNQGLSKWG